MELDIAFHWCAQCQHPVYAPQPGICPICRESLKPLTTDARPVFARERRILQFYGHGPLIRDAVWRASKSRYYYINGKQVTLPESEQVKKDLTDIAEYIRDSDHYDALDQQLILDYQHQLEANRPRLLALEDEAFQFIQHAVRRFSRRTIMVSFSGGKDSTVVSDLVRRALGSSDILHVFGDTTLEDENTYEYVRLFQEQNPLIPFFNARAEHNFHELVEDLDILHVFGDTTLEDENTYEYVRLFQEQNPLIPFFNARAEHNFHELVEEMGPPSRVMRWCCTIFKAGPINNLLQSLGDQKVLTFYGIRRDESQR